MKNRCIHSLDIDKDRIICATAFVDSKNRITSFVIEKSESFGIKKGKVIDINLLTKSIKDCAVRLQKKIGKKVEKFYVNILSKDINLKSASGIILLNEGVDKVVTDRDIERLIQNTCSLNLNKDEKLLHKITKRFILDEKLVLKDPKNLYGQKLGVELSLITSPVNDIENILKAIQNAGFLVEDFVFSGLSIGLAVMSEDKENFILIDIRRDLTQMLYFEGKILRDLKIFDFGSEDLSKDLAESLNISLSLAEELKQTHGTLEIKNNRDKIFIKTEHSYKSIRRAEISRVLYLSVKEMLNSLKKKIPKNFSQGVIVITGDVVFLEEFLEFAESVFGLPVVMGRLGFRRDVEGFGKDISYWGLKDSLSLQDSILSVGNFGLVIYALKKNHQKIVQNFSSNFISRALEKLKNIYYDYF